MDQSSPPIGLLLAQTARQTTRAFEDALVATGGSLAMWLVLQALAADGSMMQADLGVRLGVKGSTLTHHLNRLEALGLILRSRTTTDRRNHSVTLLPPGHARYHGLRAAAQAYDRTLQDALDPVEMAILRTFLQRLGTAAKAHPKAC
jgi:MarR family transcriptional regulator, transcriptional regulator for hemolysin